jgi:hypothetical protein
MNYYENLKLMSKKKMIYGLPFIENKKDIYEGCDLGKIHRESFLKEKDMSGPMSTNSHNDNRYFITFINIFSRIFGFIF